MSKYKIVKRQDGKYNFADENDVYVSEIWFDEVQDTLEARNYFRVRIAQQWYAMGCKGDLLAIYNYG